MYISVCHIQMKEDTFLMYNLLFICRYHILRVIIKLIFGSNFFGYCMSAEVTFFGTVCQILDVESDCNVFELS